MKDDSFSHERTGSTALIPLSTRPRQRYGNPARAPLVVQLLAHHADCPQYRALRRTSVSDALEAYKSVVLLGSPQKKSPNRVRGF